MNAAILEITLSVLVARSMHLHMLRGFHAAIVSHLVVRDLNLLCVLHLDLTIDFVKLLTSESVR